MGWVTQETIVFGADTVERQIGDQITDLGHRLTVNGATGVPVALALVAQFGAYRGVQAEFNLRAAYLPTLFDSSAAAGGTFPAGPATVTTTLGALVGFNTSFSICDGNGNLHSWAYGNNAGAGGDNDYIDAGGLVADAEIATRIETRINAIAIVDLFVGRVSNVLTIIAPSGVSVFSSDAGVVVT